MIINNYEMAESYIHSLTRFGSQLGLERMEKLLELMDNPHKKLKFIHIAGTNGKGTTANMCSNILASAGYKVGMYTSPFVDHFRERFQINGEMISKKTFTKLAASIEQYAARLESQGLQVTEFEAITAIAFQYFYQSGCDIVCLEVGLGGRFDATNVIGTPEVAIITSISMDHVAILGETIEKIAFEKAGIIKEGTTVVAYPLQNADALDVLNKKCRETNSMLVMPDLSLLNTISFAFDKTSFTYANIRYSLRLPGEHQMYNAIAVITAMWELVKKGYVIDSTSIVVNTCKTSPPARFERIGRRPPYIYMDGAHNIQAITALAKNVDLMHNDNIVCIMGMMADKDYEHAVAEMASRCKHFIAVDVDNPRAAKRSMLADVAKQYCDNVFDFEHYIDAIGKALELATGAGAVLCCGSFYMVSDLKKALTAFKQK